MTNQIELKSPKWNKPIFYTVIFILIALLVLGIAMAFYWSIFGSLKLSGRSEDWNLFSQYVGGVIGPIISLFSLITTIWIAVFLYKSQDKQQKSAEQISKRKLTLELHEQFHDQRFYYEINAPVWKMWLRWKNLPEPQREAYRQTIARSWIGFENVDSQQKLLKWIPDYDVDTSPEILHYLNKINATSLTEHEALSIFLGKWSAIWHYVNKDIIDKDLVVIFWDWYGYYMEFIQQLRGYIIELRKTEFQTEDLPEWFEGTIGLEALFRVAGKFKEKNQEVPSE